MGNEMPVRNPNRLWGWWKRVAKRIGNVQARVLLILFYFVVFGPFALAVRFLSDPMTIKPGSPRGWRSKSSAEDTPMERAIRQF